MALCQNLAIPDHLVRAFIHGRRSTQKSGEGDHGQNIKRMSVWRIRTVVKKNLQANTFYRAMHFRAKRGIAIACRLSVRLSVCLSVRLSVCDVGEL